MILRVPQFGRVSDYIGCWMMEPTAFRAHVEVIQKLDLQAHVKDEQPEVKSLMEFVQVKGGKSVAVIPILGAMMKGKSSLGGTSTIQVRRDIRQAAADPNVAGILLSFDSPGGTVAGNYDLGQDITAARKQKPVWSHIDDLCASAAYGAACQTERILANSPDALVGSIGTIMTVYDISERYAEAGIKALVFATGPLKGAGVPGSQVTEEQADYFQSIVNGSHVEFSNAVKKGRRLNDKELAAVKTGGVWHARDAIGLKLIDGIQSLGKTIEELARAAGGGKATGSTSYSLPAATMPIAAKFTVAASAYLPAAGPLDTLSHAIDVPRTIEPLTTADNRRAAPVSYTLGSTAMGFDKWLESKGINVATLDDATKSALLLAWRAETGSQATIAPAATPPAPEPQKPESSFKEKIEAIDKENERRAYIEERGLKAMRENLGNQERCKQIRTLMEAAIADEKTTRQDFDLSLLRLDRFMPPSVFSPSSPNGQITQDVLEAAICQSAKLPNIDKQFSDQAQQLAHSRYKGRISLCDMLLEAARHNNGFRGTRHDLKGMCRAAFRESGQEGYYGINAMGPSTIAVPGILSNVANKFLLSQFLFGEMTWRMIAKIQSAKDFKTMTSYRLTSAAKFVKLPPGGELEHGTLSELSYTNQLETYGRILGIGRTDLINDDLGAFTGTSAELGRGAIDSLNEVFWTEWLNDSAFFTTGNGNFDDGATDSVLSLAGLENADNIFAALTKPDGTPLGADPEILLVPRTLRATARNLMNGSITEAAKSTPTLTLKNVWEGQYRIADSRYLSNSGITGYSVTAWYLLADPNNIAAITVALLNGQETPTIETGEFDFEMLGMAMRAYMDFGVSKAEARGAIKLKGAA